MFAIIDYDAFRPSARGLYQPPYYTLGSRGSMACYLNPTRAELLSGIYYPRITATKRSVRGGFQIVLRVEFSVPKLIFGNNFDEAVDTDFDLVLDTLKQRLKEKGILLRRTKLEDVLVSKVDYAKNIILEPYTTSRQIISELTKADMSLYLDLEEAKYRNAGYGVKYRNNSFELACYDKVKDLIKGKVSDKKTEEKDNAIQLNLFDKVLRPNSIEVFRVEARLNSRLKIRQTFKSLGIEAKPTFKDVYSNHIGKKIVQHYWSLLENGYKTIEYTPNSPSNFFNEISSSNPDLRLSTVLKIIAMKQLIDEVGVRGYRNIASNFSKSAWSSSKQLLDSINLPTQIWTPLSQISKSIELFQPVKLDDYSDRLYSNSK